MSHRFLVSMTVVIAVASLVPAPVSAAALLAHTLLAHCLTVTVR